MRDVLPVALVADDEPLLRQQLRTRLEALWPELERIDEAANGVEALVRIDDARPAVCFLDIRMPGLGGLDVARRLRARHAAGDDGGEPLPEIVFVTAYDAHAIEAFDHGALDYLLKPYEPERLAETVARVKARLARATAAPAPHDLARLAADDDVLARLVAKLRGDGARPTLQWIKASVGNTVRLIPVDDVLYFQADEKYTRVVLADGEALIRKPVKELVAELDGERFWQIHRATIVNTHAIAGVVRGVRDSADLRLKDRPETLVVSRVYLSLFRQM